MDMEGGCLHYKDVDTIKVYLPLIVFYIVVTWGIAVWFHELTTVVSLVGVVISSISLMGIYIAVALRLSSSIRQIVKIHSFLAPFTYIALVFTSAILGNSHTASNISVADINSDSYFFQHFKFSDGDILLHFTTCGTMVDGNSSSQFAVAPLVVSSQNYEAIPAFVFTQHVSPSCVLDSSTNWNTSLREGSLISANIPNEFIRQRYSNFTLGPNAATILIKWEKVDSYISNSQRNMIIIASSISGWHFIIFFIYLIYVLDWRTMVQKMCPSGSHVRYEEI